MHFLLRFYRLKRRWKLEIFPRYEALNQVIIKDRFPISTVDELIDELHGLGFFDIGNKIRISLN